MPPPIRLGGNFPRLAHLREHVTYLDGAAYELAAVLLPARWPLSKAALLDVTATLLDLWPARRNTLEGTAPERAYSDAMAARAGRVARSSDANAAVAAAWGLSEFGAASKIRRGRQHLPEVEVGPEGVRVGWPGTPLETVHVELTIVRGEEAVRVLKAAGIDADRVLPEPVAPRARLAERLGLVSEPIPDDVRDRELERLGAALFGLVDLREP